MDSSVLFSVIIPTYNRASLLGKTIQSVLSQRFERFELLIIDDGSTDQTEEVVHSFKDPRICYFKKQNGERAAARNFGIQKAKGNYITFLDSDDLLKENHLMVANEYIEQDHPPVFHQAYDVIDDNGKVVYPWKALDSPVNDKLMEGNFLSCLGVFIKREVLLEHSFNEDRDMSGSEDYELWLRLAARFPILTFPDVTALLVNHDARSVINFEPDKLITRIDKLRYYLMKDISFMKMYGPKLNRFHAYLDIYLALHIALLPGSKKLATKIWWQSFQRFPGIIFNKRFWIVLKKMT